MRKNDLFHSNMKVRAACKKLIQAVNENPSAFDGIEFGNHSVVAKKNDNKSFHEISLAGMMVIMISKFLGWH